MMKNDTAFLSFICVLTAIEALAGYRYPDSGETALPGERFRQSIRTCFPETYHALAEALWRFRNGMIQGCSPRTSALTEHQSQLHLRRTSEGPAVLNAEDFCASLLLASQKYFAELEAASHPETTFLARLQNPQGGNIAV